MRQMAYIIPERGEVMRVGAEPVVQWGQDEESGLPRFTVLAPGWCLKTSDGHYVRLGAGAFISATIEKWDGEMLVPSSTSPDIESRGVWIAGFTLAELRAIRVGRESEGWVSVRARLWWLRQLLKGRFSPSRADTRGRQCGR